MQIYSNLKRHMQNTRLQDLALPGRYFLKFGLSFYYTLVKGVWQSLKQSPDFDKEAFLTY